MAQFFRNRISVLNRELIKRNNSTRFRQLASKVHASRVDSSRLQKQATPSFLQEEKKFELGSLGWRPTEFSDPNVKKLISKIYSLSKAKKLEAALDLWQREKSSVKVGVELYTVVLEACAFNRDIVEMERLLDQMRQEDIQPDILTCIVICKGYSRAKDLDKARGVVYKVKDDPTLPLHSSLLNCCLSCFAERGDIEGAWEIFGLFDSENIKPTLITFNVLLNACHKSGKHEEAIKLFRILLNSNLKIATITYNTFFAALCKGGSQDDFEYFWRDMLSRSIRPDNITYNTAMKFFGSHGNSSMVKNTFQRMRLMKIKPSVINYGTLMDSLSRCGEYQQSYDVFFNLEQHQKCHSLYSTMLNILFYHKRWDLFDQVCEEGMSSGVLVPENFHKDRSKLNCHGMNFPVAFALIRHVLSIYRSEQWSGEIQILCDGKNLLGLPELLESDLQIKAVVCKDSFTLSELSVSKYFERNPILYDI